VNMHPGAQLLTAIHPSQAFVAVCNENSI